MSVIEFKREKPGYHDIVSALRNIIEEIESGEQEWPITTLVVVMGHTDDQPGGHQVYHRTYGLGPRSDPFTCKGLLADVIHNGFGSD